MSSTGPSEQDILKEIINGRLFKLDSMVNQTQPLVACPDLTLAIYLYLFNLREVEARRTFTNSETEKRIERILLIQAHDRQDSPDSEPSLSLRDKEQGDPKARSTELGQKLLGSVLESFETAFRMISETNSFFGKTDTVEQRLCQYFALRIKLHLHLGRPDDLPVTDKLDALDENQSFCALAFHLLNKNDQHAVAKVGKLHSAYRMNGHINWLHMLIHRNNNHLSKAKACWLNASFWPPSIITCKKSALYFLVNLYVLQASPEFAHCIARCIMDDISLWTRQPHSRQRKWRVYKTKLNC